MTLKELSPEEAKLCRQAVYAAMNYISDEVPERELLECALDADRVFTIGKLNKELYNKFLSAILEALKKKNGWSVIRKWLEEGK